jgi:hypothetical protein
MEHLLKPFALAAAFALALSCLSAHAQLTVYGKLDFDHATSIYNGSSLNLFGGGVGVEDTLLHAGPLSLGGDLRGDLTSGSQYSQYSLFVGLPVGLKLHTVKPYIEPLIGLGGAKSTGPTAPGINSSYSSGIAYGGVGGIVLTVLPHLDWRAVEVGYTTKHASSKPTISSGLGFRF